MKLQTLDYIYILEIILHRYLTLPKCMMITKKKIYNIMRTIFIHNQIKISIKNK